MVNLLQIVVVYFCCIRLETTKYDLCRWNSRNFLKKHLCTLPS